MKPPVVAGIGLGGNVGDSVRILREAIVALDAMPHGRVRAASRLYRTPAWGLEAQADFVNAAVALETRLEPRRLLDVLLETERAFGRVRADDSSDRWGPRTLDLDLLLYADVAIDEPGLRVPHPQLHRRAFALVPLLEVLPAARIPGIGSVRAALDALGGEEPGRLLPL